MSRPVYEVKAELFKALGHPARIRILHALRDGEASVTDIARKVEVTGSTLSQHLAVLRRADVVATRREGSSIRYALADPRVLQLLEIARQLLTTSLEDRHVLLADLEELALE